MIFTLLLKMAGFIIMLISSLLSLAGKILPTPVVEVIEPVVQAVYRYDFIFPVQDLMFVVIFVISFEISLFLITSVVSFINWVRGSGEIKI